MQNTYSKILKDAEKRAKEKGLEETAIKSLLLEASGLSPTEMYLSLKEVPSEEIVSKFNGYLDQYVNEGKPVQYIVGYAYFYGYRILVNEGTLIPRWETEELASNILIYYSRLFGHEKVRALDLGTGSGAIAIALKKEEEENLTVFASDISEDAIKMARKSAELNGADVEFRTGSWFEPFKEDEKFDIIVSNPPYLTTTEYVEDIVKNNEPDVALYGGEDGLKFYRVILSNARKHLKDKFIMGFEHGYQMKEGLNKIIREYFPDEEIINLKDSADKDRMTLIISK